MDDYQQDWQEYKRQRNQFWLVFVSYVPVCSAVAFVSLKLFHTLTPGFIVALFWMGLFLYTEIRLNTFSCPRCRNSFSSTWWYNKGFFARKCVHCGLRKYEN
jgi:hypothetical protein